VIWISLVVGYIQNGMGWSDLLSQQPHIIGGFFAGIIAPLALVLLGVSGAWIGNLTALEPYKWYFIAATAGFLAAGFRQVYFKAKPPCDEGSYCARPASSAITKSVLWIATALVALSVTIDWWAPLFY